MQTDCDFLISAMRTWLILLLLITGLWAQNIPFVMDHPVYHFLDRQEALGHTNQEYWSIRPYSYDQIQEMLVEIESHAKDLRAHDLKTLRAFQRELNRDLPEDEIRFPWSRSTLNGLAHPDSEAVKPFFMTYRKGEALGWINWSETFRIQHNGETNRGYHTDHLGIYGSQGAIAFTTQFTYYRVTKNDAFSELPESYKEGYILERDEIKWLNWDHPTSSLTFEHNDFSLGIHRQPVYWGYSPDNSPIFSDNVYPLPHMEWSTRMKHLRYRFIHARLSDVDPPLSDTLNVRRNVSAHRVEFDLTPNFEFAFNEMLVYAYRDFELAYLNPVNFLFAEEHVQDNLLMALEFKWRMRPGIMTYGTWLFDELNYLELFSSWWGNKFVFQLGASYTPQSNLPTLSLEYTAARPWTYSHQYPVNSYTSAGRSLGLKAGPNTASWRLGAHWQATPKLFLAGEYEYLGRGDHPGNDPLRSYDERTEEQLANSDFIQGEILATEVLHVNLSYRFSRSLLSFVNYHKNEFIEAGITMNW